MKIDELDESQGLTRELVDHYLNRTGWCNMPDPDIRLLKPQYAHVSFKMGLSAAVERIASIEGRSVQSLLREINPRMRGPGYPSDAAAKAHGDGGWWVFQHLADADGSALCGRSGGELHMAQMVMSSASGDVRFYWERGLMGEPCDEACMWWPCDEHGNKVRWPTDAEGKML